jgi:hypothetical protein
MRTKFKFSTAHETSHGWSTPQYAALSVALSVSRDDDDDGLLLSL